MTNENERYWFFVAGVCVTILFFTLLISGSDGCSMPKLEIEMNVHLDGALDHNQNGYLRHDHRLQTLPLRGGMPMPRSAEKTVSDTVDGQVPANETDFFE